MAQKYAFQGDTTQVAKAIGKDLPISTKTAVLMGKFIRGKPVARARTELQNILKFKQAMPVTKFSEGAGHKPGMGPGKFPQKATTEILGVLNAAVANASDLGLGDDLIVAAYTANRGAQRPKYGRNRGRQNKSTHVEIIVKELSQKKEAKKEEQDGN